MNYARHSERKRGNGSNPLNRSDSLPIKTISRNQINTAVEDYLKKGGRITKITEEDVLARRQEELTTNFKFDESYEFLNGDFTWN